MDCLKLLIEKYPTYEKTHSAKIRFAESWLKLDDATKKKSLGTDDKVAAAEKEVSSLLSGLKDMKSLEKLNEDFLK